MLYSSNYKKRNYCTKVTGKCSGFLCESYRRGNCIGVMWELQDRNGNIIAMLPPPKYDDIDISEIMMKIIEEIHKNGYIKKDEVIQKLKNKFGITLSDRMLKYYGTVGLIDPGIVTRVPGIRGSVSIYKQKTPDFINFFNILKKHYKLTFSKILEFSNILNFRDKEKLELYWRHYESHRVTDKGKGRYFKQYLLDVSGFEIFAILRAVLELDNITGSLEDISITSVDVAKDEKGEFKITVKFFKDIKEEVIFTENGVKVV